MQKQEDNSNPIPALNVDSLKVDLVVIQNTCSEKEDSNSVTASIKSVKESSLDSATKYPTPITWVNVKKSVAERTRHQRHYDRRVNKRQLQTQESKIDMSKVVDADLVFIESSGTELEVQDDSSRPGNDTAADDVDIRPVYNEQQWMRSVTQHYLPKRRESVFAKSDHMIASSESRNSSKNMPRFSLNDMVHNHYLDEARKNTQERYRNSKTSVMPSARFQSTANGSKPKPRSTNHSTRSLPCVFNANHDAYIAKLLKEVNSRAKIQSHKTRNSNKPVDQKSHTQKPGRQIFTGHRFSPNKTSPVYEKTSPRSDLRWKPTGRIFKSVGLRWIPTGKVVASLAQARLKETPKWFNRK
ncbi:hypothetical protein Tco_0582488 [Tanacetum coccineum]